MSAQVHRGTLVIGLLAIASAVADDHDAPAPEKIAIAATVIPEGPPRSVEVAAGELLDPILASLPAGSTVHLLPGVHAGPLRIDRPLTVVGPAEIVGPGHGSVVLIGAPDVTIRNLEITGSGIDATAGDAGVVIGADRVHLEDLRIVHTFLGVDLRQSNDCVVSGVEIIGREDGPIGTHGDGIRLWESDRNLLTNNHLEHVRDMVAWYSEDNRFVNNRSEHSRYGVHLMHADRAVIRGNQFTHDVVGVFAMYSAGVQVEDNLVVGSDGPAGMGIGLKESDAVVVTHNRLFASTVGLYLDSTPNRPDRSADIGENVLAYNHIGARFHSVRAGATFTANDFVENHLQVTVDGGSRADKVHFETNRWSDYAGYDLDGDGLGDLPYAPRPLSRSVVDRAPNAAFFDGTVAALVLDLLGAAFPMWAPAETLRDAHPRLGFGGAA